MARIGFKGNREYQEVGEVIIGAWFKLLDAGGSLTLDDLRPEITAAINEILDSNNGQITINILFDTRPSPGTGIVNVVIPMWPEGVSNVADLIAYLQTFHDKTSGRHFSDELGNALIFGCGK